MYPFVFVLFVFVCLSVFCSGVLQGRSVCGWGCLGGFGVGGWRSGISRFMDKKEVID